MNQIKKALLLTGCILLNISLFSCQNLMEKKYRYTTDAFRPDGYDMAFYLRYFSFPGHSIPIYTTRLSQSFGTKGGGDVIGNGFNVVPDSLHLGFYSYTEDKFYEGHFALPRERLIQMFEEDSDDPNEKGKTFDDSQSGRRLPYRKYDGLTVSIVPGGKVYLWIFGETDQVGIGVYQAKEVQLPWDHFREYPEEPTRQEISEKYKKDSIPYGLWDEYRQRISWKYRMEGGEFYYLFNIQMINAEEEGVYSPALENDIPKERAVPYQTRFFFKDKKDDTYEARVFFTKDEKYYLKKYKSGPGTYWPEDLRKEETYKVFHQLGKEQPLELVFKIDVNDPEKMTIWVKNKERSQELKEVIVYVFPHQFKKQ